MNTNNNWSPKTAAQRLNTSLDRLAENKPDTESIFSITFESRVRQDLADLEEKQTTDLSGALVSVKALFDVEGEVTHAGTRFLAESEAATQDALAISRLRTSGALLLGHTNMSELAYSGLGVNPHYGTADNPLFPGHVPGGSTSGGAVSVATGLVDIAIGSDTGGSLRIPAAFCGITGFKPSQPTISRKGSVPLSDTLDCVGPMAQSVSACTQAWQVMAGISDDELLKQTSSTPLTFHVSRNFGFDGLDPIISNGFEDLLARLTNAGKTIVDEPLGFLRNYAQIAPWQLTSVECRAHFEKQFQEQAELFDPRVHSRMGRADELSSVQYRQTLNLRTTFVEAMNQGLSERVLLLPTVAILPPTATSLKDDAVFTQQNLMALRNTSLANIGDACSLAIPFEYEGVTLSAMLVSVGGSDADLLAAGRALEKLISI
ncbi:amidase family protein [Leucothrix arctica]|uniref:Amidase n=1 Tax=Leucothrix arctica TaxID=1481894 RepID=A0A317CC57_9GAMM|nr:amidase family protein [Leucothrix arctica]PWQ95959.1 amidase [Leucothrix arctica]